MTKYSVLMEKANECIKKAIETKDLFLQKFYVNAAQGFTSKAARLLIGEAYEQR